MFRRDQSSDDKRTLYVFISAYILYDYGFGDFRELTKDRKDNSDRLRGVPLDDLRVELEGEKLPESRFRFPVPRARRPEEE